MSLFAVPPTIILQLKKVTASEARRLLEPYRGGMEDDAYTNLLALALPDTAPSAGNAVTVVTHDPNRRFFMASAWIVGASFNQLGALFGIARQSAQQQVERVLPVNKREEYLGKRMKVTYDQLSRMHQVFLANPGGWGSNPKEAGFLLFEAAQDAD